MKKRLYNSTFKLLLALCMVVLLAACGSEKKKETGEASEEFDKAAKEISEKVEKVIYDIPTPSEIPYLIQSTGADFNPEIVNSTEQYETYLNNTNVTAINLGVYATDIGYLSSYGKTQKALNYMDVCVKMAESLGISDAIDLKILERFEKNLSNTDSMASILDEAISKSDDYLSENDRNEVAALVVSGTFIEGLYTATQIVDTYPKDLLADDQRMTVLTPIIRVLVKQKESLSDLISLLESLDSQTEMVKSTLASLKELKSTYDKLDAESKISGGNESEILTDEALTEIIEKVNTLRTQLVTI